MYLHSITPTVLEHADDYAGMYTHFFGEPHNLHLRARSRLNESCKANATDKGLFCPRVCLDFNLIANARCIVRKVLSLVKD